MGTISQPHLYAVAWAKIKTKQYKKTLSVLVMYPRFYFHTSLIQLILLETTPTSKWYLAFIFLSEPESITNIQLYSQQMFLKKEF